MDNRPMLKVSVIVTITVEEGVGVVLGNIYSFTH